MVAYNKRIFCAKKLQVQPQLRKLSSLQEKRDVMKLDIPNVFVKPDIALEGDMIIMKIRG